MEEKYKEIYEQLKKETQNTLENKNSEKFIDEFKQIVRDRIKKIHEQLDVKKEEIIKLALEAYEKETSGEVDPKEEEIKRKILKGKKEEKKEEVNPESFKGKIQSLVANLDGVLHKTESLEETIKVFKESNLSQLLELKDGDFYFKPERKLKYILMGKVFWDLGWSTSMNKPQNSDIDKTDPNQLNVHANSCYNYYQTNKPIVDENVLVVLETNIYKTDGYLYFGIMNENLQPNNNCMCCTIRDCTYIRSSGYVVEQGKQNNNNKVNFSSKKGESETIVEIRVLGKEKECYFKVNDEEEQGPFKLPTGDKFYITSGSCNTANGTIKIISSLIIG